MFDSIFNTYHDAPIVCGATTDLGFCLWNRDLWYSSWNFWSCICESPGRA